MDYNGLFLLGIRHSTKPGSKSSEKLTELLQKVLGHIEGSLSKPVCRLGAELDCRSEFVRIAEVGCPFI